MNKHTHTRGLTLIELIFTFLIIGFLAATLYPCVSVAIEASRGITCRSNLRQMAIAAHAYAVYGEMPPALERDGATTRTWESFLWECDPRSATSRQVHQCPSFKGAANWDGDHYTGYNYNSSYIGGTRMKRNGVLIEEVSTPSANLGDIRHPSHCAIFGDGQYESGANKFMRSPFPGRLDADAGLALAGTQGFRHRGRTTNVAFADGSVRPLAVRYTTSAARGTPAKNCGFLSEDNSFYTTE